MIVGCNGCSHLAQCGGLDGVPDLFGCHRVSTNTCRERSWTCPECDPLLYLRRTAEVRARSTTASPIGTAAELPPYIPNIHHAASWTGTLSASHIAIPTHRVLVGQGEAYGPAFRSGAALRRHFHVTSDANVFLISVADDTHLERYWAFGRLAGVPAKLARLRITAMSVPNFSFYRDAHRFHLLYNRGRLAACLSELSEAGIAVFPHIHSLSVGDRSYWIGWLRETTRIRHVCREFQTGNDVAEIEELATIRDQCGRELHPVIVGGASYVTDLRRLFSKSTVVDSQPFLKAQFGQRAVVRDGKLRWEAARYRGAKGLGARIEHNVGVYSHYIANRYDEGRQTSMFDVFDRAIRLRGAIRHRDDVDAIDPRQQTLLLYPGSRSVGPSQRAPE